MMKLIVTIKPTLHSDPRNAGGWGLECTTISSIYVQVVCAICNFRIFRVYLDCNVPLRHAVYSIAHIIPLHITNGHANGNYTRSVVHVDDNDGKTHRILLAP